MPMVVSSHDLYVDTLAYTLGYVVPHPDTPQEVTPASTGVEPRKHTIGPPLSPCNQF
ncbi:hypothetical protein DPMN_193451 [Dreissena polymorpha]|uniref:Uncharacterized protein n=1 Tax=Dreissena polymorpha TaxID=45954 RepID=A0A9D3Y1U7_DREPO|nr:hypothetical protein DPMN_193451 [Dreissena polymorpha]